MNRDLLTRRSDPHPLLEQLTNLQLKFFKNETSPMTDMKRLFTNSTVSSPREWGKYHRNTFEIILTTNISFQGYYIYIETSWPRRLGDTARMFGGPFSGIRCMRFFYHMYGRHIADLQIFVRELETGVENYVWGRYKNQGKFWRSSNTTVFGKNYTVRSVTEELFF